MPIVTTMVSATAIAVMYIDGDISLLSFFRAIRMMRMLPGTPGETAAEHQHNILNYTERTTALVPKIANA
jgi:hypothetical protein